MASWVISECGLRPLPRIYARPRSAASCFNSKNPVKNLRFLDENVKIPMMGSRNWGLRVSVPMSVPSVSEEEERFERVVEEENEFDPGAAPPFKLSNVRAAIPKHCWVKDPVRSMSYVLRDVLIVFGLAVAASFVNNWVVWPLYWIAQGTMFWALFVLGHDW